MDAGKTPLDPTMVTPSFGDIPTNGPTLSSPGSPGTVPVNFEGTPPDDDEQLPDYASSLPQRRAPVTHIFPLTKLGSSSHWLKLVVSSLAVSPQHVPYFFFGQPINGTVELNLDKPEHFTKIDVEVRISCRFGF
jgi:hypothetical protein